jgi:hypothetical protein
MCPHCGWNNIRRSIEPHFYDILLRVLFLRIYRCRTCRCRFVWLA